MIVDNHRVVMTLLKESVMSKSVCVSFSKRLISISYRQKNAANRRVRLPHNSLHRQRENPLLISIDGAHH